MIKLALAQLRLSDSIADNLSLALSSIDEAARAGAQLVCFPELQFSPFFPAAPARRDVAREYLMELDGPEMRALREAARRHQCVVVANLYLRRGADAYDSSPLIDADGAIAGVTDMVHIAQLPGFYEQDYYRESESGFAAYASAAGSVGVVVCFDRHLPESVRSCVLNGAELVVIPTANVRGENLELFEWEIRVQAFHNQCYIAMCNRVGSEHEGAAIFAGQSLVAGPDGELVAKASDEAGLILADIDYERVRRIRRERPYLKLRRPERYRS